MAIQKCSCTNLQQDRLHGEGHRVKNLTAKGTDKNNFRCTVCGVDSSPAFATNKKGKK